MSEPRTRELMLRAVQVLAFKDAYLKHLLRRAIRLKLGVVAEVAAWASQLVPFDWIAHDQ